MLDCAFGVTLINPNNTSMVECGLKDDCIVYCNGFDGAICADINIVCKNRDTNTNCQLICGMFFVVLVIHGVCSACF